jgi:hypothetical protein
MRDRRIVLLLGLLAALDGGCATDRGTWSFPSIPLGVGERIVGYDVFLTGASVVAVENIPLDWDVDLDTDLAWRPRVSGICHHGAGALFSATELPSLTLVFDKDRPFKAEGSISVTVDFEHDTTRPFSSAEWRGK